MSLHARPSFPSKTSRSSPGNGPKRAGAASSTTCAPAGRCGPTRGRAARAARWRSRSTPTTRPTSCARAASRSAGSRRASTATAQGVPRILALLQKHDDPGELLRAGRRPRCCIPTSSAAWSPRATRSASTAGSTSATRCCPRTPSATCRCARPTCWRRSRASGRSASARRRGISARTRSPSPARWACSTTPR